MFVDEIRRGDLWKRLIRRARHNDTRHHRFGTISNQDRRIACADRSYAPIDILRYEAACYETGLSSGVLIVPEGNYLGLGESCDYGVYHTRRMRSPHYHRWLEHCLVAGVDYQVSAEAYLARAGSVVRALLTQQAPTEEVAILLPVPSEIMNLNAGVGTRLIE